jgi:phage baseplate assembly protein W
MHRALRFLHPVVDPARQPRPDAAPGPPRGLAVSPGGALEVVEGEASVRQAILLLLSTRPGERVMRPEYGCDLHRLMFSPNDDTTAGLAIYYVRRALTRWERRIEIVRLDANRGGEHGQILNIRLEYRIRETRQVRTLELPFDLAGGLS